MTDDTINAGHDSSHSLLALDQINRRPQIPRTQMTYHPIPYSFKLIDCIHSTDFFTYIGNVFEYSKPLLDEKAFYMRYLLGQPKLYPDMLCCLFTLYHIHVQLNHQYSLNNRSLLSGTRTD